MQAMKGFAAGLVALVVCPCHLPLTLPVLLALTGGTAVGGWLTANQWLIWLASLALFTGGVVLIMRWMSPTASGAQCAAPQPKQAQAPPAPTRVEPSVQTHVNGSTQPKEASHV